MAARGDGQRRGGGGGGGGGRPFVHHQRGGPPIHTKPAPPVDREKTCPLLLRVFTKVGGHHSQADFAVRGKEPKDEVQIYTWMDATLRELTDLADIHFAYPGSRTRDHVFDGSLRPWLGDLVEATKKGLDCQVKEVAPEARRRDALLSFAFVYPTKTGHFTVKEVGKTFSYPNARRPDDGTKALGNLSFEVSVVRRIKH